jgi:hypothetical protein
VDGFDQTAMEMVAKDVSIEMAELFLKYGGKVKDTKVMIDAAEVDRADLIPLLVKPHGEDVNGLAAGLLMKSIK